MDDAGIGPIRAIKKQTIYIHDKEDSGFPA